MQRKLNSYDLRYKKKYEDAKSRLTKRHKEKYENAKNIIAKRNKQFSLLFKALQEPRAICGIIEFTMEADSVFFKGTGITLQDMLVLIWAKEKIAFSAADGRGFLKTMPAYILKRSHEPLHTLRRLKTNRYLNSTVSCGEKRYFVSGDGEILINEFTSFFKKAFFNIASIIIESVKKK